jgi:hypothetical protein
MKNITEHTGKLENLERMKSSVYGNPRFSFTVDGYKIVTVPDSSHGYSIESYRGKTVRVQIGTHYGRLSLAGIWEA